MELRLREIRRAKGLTLADVAARCAPATTAQTIGRLETGMRRLSMGWLTRVAAALEVSPSDLVAPPEQGDIPVAAFLSGAGAEAPSHPMVLTAPALQGALLGVIVQVTQGDYRAGDQLWCRRHEPDAFAACLNRDVLAPLPAGRFAFGRLVSAVGANLRLLPPVSGARLLEVKDAAWIAPVATLIRSFS